MPAAPQKRTSGDLLVGAEERIAAILDKAINGSTVTETDEQAVVHARSAPPRASRSHGCSCS